MIEIYASAVVICLASLVAGQGLLVLVGVRRSSWIAPALGFAALLIVSRLAIRLPGRDATSLIVDAVLLAGAIALWARAGIGFGSTLRRALPLGVLILALTAIPFLANDRTGVFGVGVYSNDVAAHMFWTDWLRDAFDPSPNGIRIGYPLGPHSLVATVAQALGAGVDNAFIGLLVAIPVLTAWTALAALEELPAGRRAIAATLVGLSYLGISYLAQSAFKETIEGLLLIGFALALRELVREAEPGPRRGLILALGVLLAGSVYTYGYPGLYWLLGTAGAWAAAELLLVWRRESFGAAIGRLRENVPAGLMAGAVLLVLVAPELARVVDFASSGAVDYVRGQSGTLREQVSPLEALGVWPIGNFRIHPPEPRQAIGIAIAVAGVVWGLVWWARRRELTVPAALVAGAAIYVGTRFRGGIYVEAKALAVVAPIASLLALRALLAIQPRSLLRGTLAVAFVIGAAVSSFLALRETPVGPRGHDEQLASLRPQLDGQPTLFMGVSRFSEHYLAGVKLKSPGGYWVRHIKSRPNKEWFGKAPLDFDNVAPERLDEFRFAITPRTSYQSAPPANWRPIRQTASFTLWERQGPTAIRETLQPERVIGPGAVLDCGTPEGLTVSRRGGRAAVLPDPVVTSQRGWRPNQFLGTGDDAMSRLDLGPGRWRIAIQYHTPFELIVDMPGLNARLPANLDGQVPNSGQGPWYDIGTVEAQGPVRVTARPGPRTWAQRLLEVEREGIVGGLAAVREGATARTVPLRQACGRYVDWYEPAS